VTKRLLLSYLGLTLFVLVVLEIPLGVINARNERSDLTTKVERDAVSLATLAAGAVGRERPSNALAALAASYERRTGGRVVIVDRRGFAVIDTNPPAGGARSFATRPEIASALRGEVSTGVRNSRTLQQDLLYVAVPVASGSSVKGAVRITYPLSSVNKRIWRYWLMLLAIAGLVLAIGALIGFRFARWVSSPLRHLETVAEQAGAGDLTIRAEDHRGPPEVRSLAATFNRMIAELEQLVRSQEEFVADASHQLRTPLTALRLRLENLERDVNERGRDDLGRALEEVERLSRLVGGLLALARAEVSPPERIDLAAAVAERLDAWSVLAEERGVKLVADVRGFALVGRDRLGQALENLIANALAIAPRGSTIAITGTDGELHVRDQGPGMTAEQRARAFDRFWRGTSGGGGSGLGLAIVKRLVESDEGSIELREEPGGGLDAVLRLQNA
jgi:signal transduction histidine kinase